MARVQFGADWRQPLGPNSSIDGLEDQAAKAHGHAREFAQQVLAAAE